MKSNLFVAVVLTLALSACGYGREEDKEIKRKEDLQELSQDMNNTVASMSTLKIQLRDSLADYTEQEDSLSMVKADKYRLLISEIDQAEHAYQDWQKEIEFEPTNMKHEEAMAYYDQEEEKAEILRQDLRKTKDYVESEIRK